MSAFSVSFHIKPHSNFTTKVKVFPGSKESGPFTLIDLHTAGEFDGAEYISIMVHGEPERAQGLVKEMYNAISEARLKAEDPAQKGA